jgi:hypothetical protein
MSNCSDFFIFDLYLQLYQALRFSRRCEHARDPILRLNRDVLKCIFRSRYQSLALNIRTIPHPSPYPNLHRNTVIQQNMARPTVASHASNSSYCS